MKYAIIAAAVICFGFATSVNAGSSSNSQQDPLSTGSGTNTNTNTANGGAGGEGGAGGAGGDAMSRANSEAAANSRSTSEANSSSSQLQGQLQGQIQGQIATGGAQQQTATGGTGGNNQNSGNQSTSFSSTSTTSHQAPNVSMSSMFPTAPCQAVLSAGFSFIGAGGAAAGSRTLDECEKREAARIAAGIGQGAMALEIMCMGEYASKTSQCKQFQPQVAAVAAKEEEPILTARSRDSIEVKSMQGF